MYEGACVLIVIIDGCFFLPKIRKRKEKEMFRARWQKQNLAAKAYAKHMFSLSCPIQRDYSALVDYLFTLDLGIISEKETERTGGRLRC